ncbi:SNF2 helicase associated domain-containing protein [Clostridium sp. 19966]|uniref:SNF2 helicase associated domain-containing protein n=1 Tax=Clostridium sp. 19966 TaxID=2768166 RepID=UPI0028E7F260|nr:SNF2 helicase associated domain-containing protein [Clostridium sp. 19966]
MRIKEENLKEIVDDFTFRKGKQYYKEGYVEDLKIDEINDKNEKALSIFTRVISSNGFNSYDVNLQWNNTTNSIKGYCSCPAYENMEDAVPCKHIIATLLKYIKEYQPRIYSEEDSSDIEDLINKIKSNSEANEDFKRELNLELKFFSETTSNRSHLEMKVGLDKKYVVKSIKSFIKAVNEENVLEFGKSFTFDPSIYKFNAVDEKLIDMMTEVMEVDEEKYNSYNFYYNKSGSSIFSGKSMYFADKLMYRFFKLIKERAINFILDEKEFENVEIVMGEMPLKFNMELVNDEIELTQNDELPVPLDGASKIFWYEGKIYLPPKDQIAVYVPLYDMLYAREKNKMLFRKQDSEKVASYILPVLKKVSKEINIDDAVKKSFYEEPLLIRTYLDRDNKNVTAVIKYGYGEIEINPLEKTESNTEKGILIRDIIKEENSQMVLKSFGFEPRNSIYVMKDEKDIVSFITEGVTKLQELGEVYYSDSFKEIRIYGRSSMKGGIRLNDQDLLEFNFELDGVDKSELKDIFNALREKKKYFRLKKGGFVALEDKAMQELGEMVDYLDIKDKDFEKDKIILSKFNAVYLDQKIKDSDMDYLERSKNFRELANNIRDVKEMDYEVSEDMNSIMRSYQKIGYKWFKTLSTCGFGGILADEMGLGKTLQAISFLASERGDKPSIVVTPTSLVYNWQEEIEKFAPQLKTVVISGPKKKREEMMGDIEKVDVVITSYPLIKRDIDEYSQIWFNYCIIDEAQQIKNPASQNATSVKQLKAKGYFALTGTPIENSLTELWSIFDFVMPGYLLSHSKFSKKYETPIIKDENKKALKELNDHIKPFILRRMKKDVIKELPPKIEHKLIVEMTEEQKKLYAAYLDTARQTVNSEIKNNGFGKSKIKILSLLTRLRQICCDPAVFIEDFSSESGKMMALDDLLEEVTAQGHKILLFSQFTSVLKNIKKRLIKNQIGHMYLDGSTKSEERISMVKKFNQGEASVFLISLKAGGTGLNLTGADVVIHFDPWWNPAVEDQATDRAHRIGQEKTVEVIKLIAKGTIEEKIYNLQQRKKDMIKSIINKDMNEDNIIMQMSEEDIESLFS